MPDLLIRYKDSAGNVTDRRVSDFELDEPGYFFAFCHERGEGRTFKVSRVVSAIDAETGEVVEDLYSFLGIERPPEPPAPAPESLIPANPKEVLRRRGKDKRELFKPFKLALLENHARRRFYDLFGNRCFKCRSPGPLVMDHHVPIILGGRLVPGNIVALCRDCNSRKGDRPPEAFYTADELERLRPFLDGQAPVFEFEFDWRAWEVDRESYLVSIGIDPALVREVLTDPNHRFHIPPNDDSDGVGIVITIDSETILDSNNRVLAEKFGKTG